MLTYKKTLYLQCWNNDTIYKRLVNFQQMLYKELGKQHRKK